MNCFCGRRLTRLSVCPVHGHQKPLPGADSKGSIGAGEAGATGPPGAAGATGPQGATGATGPAGPGYYTLIGSAASLSNVADNTPYFFGTMTGEVPQTTANRNRIYIPRAGTIIAAEVYAYCGTAGSNEAWEMRLWINNTQAVTIDSLSVSSATRRWFNGALGNAVTTSDYFEFRSVGVNWATNPGAMRLWGCVLVQT